MKLKQLTGSAATVAVALIFLFYGAGTAQACNINSWILCFTEDTQAKDGRTLAELAQGTEDIRVFLKGQKVSKGLVHNGRYQGRVYRPFAEGSPLLDGWMTAEHPLPTGDGVIRAEMLQPGMAVKLADGSQVVIDDVEVRQYDGHVYNVDTHGAEFSFTADGLVTEGGVSHSFYETWAPIFGWVGGVAPRHELQLAAHLTPHGEGSEQNRYEPVSNPRLDGGTSVQVLSLPEFPDPYSPERPEDIPPYPWTAKEHDDRATLINSCTCNCNCGHASGNSNNSNNSGD